MEQFNTLIQQNYARLRDLYLSMTFGNRVVAALLMATLLISLGYLIVGSIKAADPASKTVRLYDGYPFNPNEKRAAENAISKAGLQGHQWIGDQLQVPANRQHLFVAAIADAKVLETSGLARRMTAESISPMLSARMMDAKMLTAKEQDCVDAIKMLAGIAHAEVHTNKRPAWERNVWARTQIMSVGVFVEAIDNQALPADTIGAIGNIVAPIFGITDMNEIKIVDTKHHRAYDGTGEQQGSAQGEYQRHQTRHQEEWNKRISRQLSQIDGIRVDTDVTLTTYRTRADFTVEHDRPTVLVEHELDYHFKKEGWDRFFRPGQVAQWGRPLIDPTGNAGPRDLIDEKKREMEKTFALQGTESKLTQLPYIPQRVRTSIQVPIDHVLKLWQSKNRMFGGAPDAVPTPADILAVQEEITEDIKQSVGNLLVEYAPSSRTDPKSLVDVTFYDPLKEEGVELTAWEQFLLFMRTHWQSLGLMSLVFGGLVVLWSISKPPKPDNIVIYEGLETPLEAIDARIAERRRLEEEAAAAETAAAEEERREFENSLGELGSIRSLREEIAELIAKNPEAAAAVIRQWIGNAVLVEAKT
ncbi:MAG: hypothetical protein FWE95_02770 [Planctomycetaceae bacterium]|nr:hypothetical protein [Planctomycetaceae bacterium]